MASRVLAPTLRTAFPTPASLRIARSFQTSSRRLAEAPLPPRKPVGAFRGGLFGFLLGSTLTGAGVYYYVLEEYKVSNHYLSEDIYTLQSSVHRVHEYVKELEEKLVELERKK